jgi:diguanylate cyclase (GGDEF)-like protein
LSSLSAAVGSKLLRAREISRELQSDPLTGLLNRAGVEAAFECARALAERAGYPLCLALLDLDRFKAINDELGHARGDEVLSRVGEVLSSALRRSDRAGRWGGDEFVILLPNADLDGATQALEKLIDRLRRESLHGGDSRLDELPPASLANLDSSAGLSQVTAERELEDVIAEADRLLYLAKAAGGGRVMTVGRLAETSGRFEDSTSALPVGSIGGRGEPAEVAGTVSRIQPSPIFVARERELEELERLLETSSSPASASSKSWSGFSRRPVRDRAWSPLSAARLAPARQRS